MQATIADLTAARAGVGRVSLGHVGVGPLRVRELSMTGTTLSMTGAQGLLQGVDVTVTLHISVEWHVHVGLPDGIPDIDVGDTVDLGSFGFSMPVGDITLPALDDLHFEIPTVTAQDVAVPETVLSLELTGAHAEGVHASGTSLPSAGFLLAGLSLTSLEADAVTVPAVGVDRVDVRSLRGDPVQVPVLTLPAITVPTAQVPLVRSTAPLTIPATLQGPSPGFNAGLLRVVLRIRPTVVTRVDRLELTGARATANVGAIVLHDVVVPYEVLDLTLSQLGVDAVEVPVLTVS